MLTCFSFDVCNFTVPQGRALTHVVSCGYLIVGYSAEISFPVCRRVTQTPGKYPTGIRCRHYRTWSLGHSPRCRTWMRIYGVMIHLQGWYALLKKSEATERTKASLPLQGSACKCVICQRDCCWFPAQHLSHRCAEHKYW